jgi:hypothetical protein
MLEFIHNHLAWIVIIIPIALIAGIIGLHEYLNMLYLNMGPDDEWPSTNVSETEINTAIAEDPNVGKES